MTSDIERIKNINFDRPPHSARTKPKTKKANTICAVGAHLLPERFQMQESIREIKAPKAHDPTRKGYEQGRAS
jgi:hypothetical protein